MEQQSRRLSSFASSHVNDSFMRILITGFASCLISLIINHLYLPSTLWAFLGFMVVFLCAQETFFIRRKLAIVRHLDAIDLLMGDQLKIKEIQPELREKLTGTLPFRPRYLVTLTSSTDRNFKEPHYVFDGVNIPVKDAINKMIDGMDPGKVAWSRHASVLFFSEDADQEVVSFKLTFDPEQVN